MTRPTIEEINSMPLADKLAYIESCNYVNSKFSIAGSSCKVFRTFKVCFKAIYIKWERLINICYNQNHPSYKNFGARNIKLSPEFLDSKVFCSWCLKNGLDNDFKYKMYIQRKDKKGDYSLENCFVVNESDVHDARKLSDIFSELKRRQAYDNLHHESVTYVIFYHRYMVDDWDMTDALMTPVVRNHERDIGKFSVNAFYKSHSTPDSCSLQIYCKRYYRCRSFGYRFDPYAALDPAWSPGPGNAAETEYLARRRKEKENKEE